MYAHQQKTERKLAADGVFLKNFAITKTNLSLSHIKLNLKLFKVEYENNEKKLESVYSARIRAGKRRTYFFDVRATRGNDYYLTITESKKRFGQDGKFFYEKHKIFLYKEDFEKFLDGLNEAVDHIKENAPPISSVSENTESNSGEKDVNFEDLGN